MTTSTRGFSRAVARGTAIAAFATGAVLSVAPAAHASGTGTTCPVGRFCLYFNSSQQGARADLAVTDAALTNELIDDGPVGANGWKVVVNNNAASYWNRTDREIIVYDGQNCTYGAAGTASGLGAGTKGNLTLKNKVSSMKLVINGDWRSGCSTNVDQSRY